MQINEVEELVGITKPNIRYYEKEGLLTPERNHLNGYRDYSNEDIMVLKKIKLLRMLGVPVADIKSAQLLERDLSTVLEKRLAVIEKEIKDLGQQQLLCQSLMQRTEQFDSIDVGLYELKASLKWEDQASTQEAKRVRITKFQHILKWITIILGTGIGTSSLVFQTVMPGYELPGWFMLPAVCIVFVLLIIDIILANVTR